MSNTQEPGGSVVGGGGGMVGGGGGGVVGGGQGSGLQMGGQDVN